MAPDSDQSVAAGTPVATSAVSEPHARSGELTAQPPAASNELAQLLQHAATALLPETLVLVLSHLPAVELARLASVHKSFLVGWRALRALRPGSYEPPGAGDFEFVEGLSRLERASFFGDLGVIRCMLAAGVDEHGTPLLQARINAWEDKPAPERRVLDAALWHAAICGWTEAVRLLLSSGADVNADDDWALRTASDWGHADVLQLLIQHGANVHARDDFPLKAASQNGHTDVVQLLLQHGADIHDDCDCALMLASSYDHADVVQLLLQHGATVHVAWPDVALCNASAFGEKAVVRFLIRQGADVHAEDNNALGSACMNGHAAVVQLLITALMCTLATMRCWCSHLNMATWTSCSCSSSTATARTLATTSGCGRPCRLH